MNQLMQFLPRTHVAYFSMEIGIRPEMRTYSGGLGILAGDSLKSATDLQLPMVFVTILCRKGYFYQVLDEEGRQSEEPNTWNVEAYCKPLDVQVSLEIDGREVWVRPWLHIYENPRGARLPMILLDTDLDANQPEDRTLTDRLYGGDSEYRLKQEIVLGLGGKKILGALGFDIHTYHMNEGHAAFLTLELLAQHRKPDKAYRRSEDKYDTAAVRKHCVFTTHTPVEAGHDRFEYSMALRCLPQTVDADTIKRFAGKDELNMTRLAMNLSSYVNGVARRHADTTRHMFPGYNVHAITNGVHVESWAHQAIASLLDRYVSEWRLDPQLLSSAADIPEGDLWQAKMVAKRDLVSKIREMTGREFDPKLPIFGVARRMTSYKRPMTILTDPDRLRGIAKKYPLQIVVAGKAHPKDLPGKDIIHNVHKMAKELEGDVDVVFVPGYTITLSRVLIPGCDVWVNTPQPPMEASGTSGMKAALNGALNFSTPDGWWIEGSVENVTGWDIGDDGEELDTEQAAAKLYDKMENVILPTYYDNPERWRWMMGQAIGRIASYFNTHRMMREYASGAYLR